MSADFLLDILGCSMLAFGLLGSAAIESNQKR
jgi:hypothetical protein